MENDLIHKAFKILNDSGFIYDWNRNIKYAANQINIDKDELEQILLDSKMYRWDKELKQYVRCELV